MLSIPNFGQIFGPLDGTPKGESHEDLYFRVTEWLRGLASSCSDNDRILAVTHNGPIACIFHYAFKASMNQFPCVSVDNVLVSILGFPCADGPGDPVLKAFNLGLAVHL